MYLLTSREESYQFQTGAEVLKVGCPSPHHPHLISDPPCVLSTAEVTLHLLSYTHP